MKTRKKLLSLILSLCLILPCMILFSACGNNDKILNYIAISLNDGEFKSNIYETRDYGNTENLDKFKIKAYYSNNSQEEIDLSQVEKSITFSYSNIENSDTTFEQYTQMCNNSTLTAGSWHIIFTYKEQQCNAYINVNKITNPNTYSVNITNKVGSSLQENHIYCGTKISGIDYTVSKGNTTLNDSQIENLYMLCGHENNQSTTLDLTTLTPQQLSELPEPNLVDNQNYILNPLYANLEYLKSGKYYVCAKINEQDNYLETYTDYQTLTIEKAPVIAKAQNLTFDYTFNYNTNDINNAYNVTFKTILNHFFTKINGQLSLIFSSDYDDNNNNLSNENKLTYETIIEHTFENSEWNYLVTGSETRISNYGTLVEVNPKAYNYDITKGADFNTITTLVKFVPDDEDYWTKDFYADSEPFEITINLYRGTHEDLSFYKQTDDNWWKYRTDDYGTPVNLGIKFQNIPSATSITEDTNVALATAFNSSLLAMYSNAPTQVLTPELYTCEFYAQNVGTYFVKCYLNPNFKFDIDNILASQYGITITPHDKTSADDESYIEYSWTIVKGDIDNQMAFYNININDSIKFDSNNSVEIRLHLNDQYKDVNFAWEVLGVGTSANGSNDSNVTGTLENIEGNNTNITKKFTATTDLTTISTRPFYVAIKITAEESTNWNAFEQIIMLIINQ